MHGPYWRGVHSANDNSASKYLFVIPAAVIGGLLSALPALFSRADVLRSLGVALVSESRSPGQRLEVFVFHLGGMPLVDVLTVCRHGLPWVLGFLVLFWASRKFSGRLRFAVSLSVWLLWLLLAGWALRSAFLPWGGRVSDWRLIAPVGLVDLAGQNQGRVFMNPSARAAVAPLAESLLDDSLPSKSLADLSNSPEKWRAEDRSRPFSAVLLAGSLMEAKPLIRHLMESPDWFLARVDNQGLLFLLGENSDFAASPVPDFPSPRERAIYLAQYSLNLDAVGFKTMSNSTMEEALSLAGQDYEVLFRASSLGASQNRWERSRKLAAAAAKARPGAFEADYLLALGFLETRAEEKAFENTLKLRRRYPRDPNVLLLHARASRAAHDYSEETKTLEHLLVLAKKGGSSTARIHVYLAQSWAQRGFPEQALSHYQSALSEGLSPAESADIRAAMSTIEDARLKK